jgi:hypothetical protein
MRLRRGKMETTTAILITQFPIALGIFWGVYELMYIRKEIKKFNQHYK